MSYAQGTGGRQSDQNQEKEKEREDRRKIPTKTSDSGADKRQGLVVAWFSACLSNRVISAAATIPMVSDPAELSRIRQIKGPSIVPVVHDPKRLRELGKGNGPAATIPTRQPFLPDKVFRMEFDVLPVLAERVAGYESSPLKFQALRLSASFKVAAQFADDTLFIQQLQDSLAWARGEVTDRFVNIISELVENFPLAKGDAEKVELVDNARRNCAACYDFWKDLRGRAFRRALEARQALASDVDSYVKEVGGNLVLAFGGLVAGAVALGTSATPAAPATLVPALLTLISSAGSIINQFRELWRDAQAQVDVIIKDIGALQSRYEEVSSSSTPKMKEGPLEVGAVLTGRLLEEFVASVAGTQRQIAQLKGKIDLMDDRLHQASTALGNAVEVLYELEHALLRMEKRAQSEGMVEKLALLKKQTDAAATYFDIGTRLQEIYEKIKEIDDLRQLHKSLSALFQDLAAELDTKNTTNIIRILTPLALVASGFASPPAEALEIITFTFSTAVGMYQPAKDLVSEGDFWNSA